LGVFLSDYQLRIFGLDIGKKRHDLEMGPNIGSNTGIIRTLDDYL